MKFRERQRLDFVRVSIRADGQHLGEITLLPGQADQLVAYYPAPGDGRMGQWAQIVISANRAEPPPRPAPRDVRPAAPRCRCLEIFIAALLITPGAWLFWAVTNAPPAM